jgi:hypothetical protein
MLTDYRDAQKEDTESFFVLLFVVATGIEYPYTSRINKWMKRTEESEIIFFHFR